MRLCGYSTSRQSNIFIGCQPHGRISLTGRKPTTQLRALSATVAQPLEHLPRNLRTGFFHMFVRQVRWRGIIPFRLRLKGQLHYRTALVFDQVQIPPL